MSGLNSLEKVLAILDLFCEAQLEWTPEQLMQELGYTRPTLYRYLKVLKDAGLLASLHGSGFTLGPRVVEMDYLLRKSDPLLLCGQPQIEKLAGMIPCTALLVRWYGERILCVAAECSTPNPLSSYHRGRPMPITRGAIARSITASLPRRQLVPFVATHRAELQSVGLGATEEEILERLRQVRKQGYVVAYGEVTPGVVGIASPILDSSGVPVASICITLAGNTIASERIEELGHAIQSSAAEISARLATTARDGNDTAADHD